MKKAFAATCLALLCCAAVSGASAASVSVSPGGSTTFSGTVSFQITGPMGIDYSGTCSMSLQGTLNTSTAALTVTSVQLPQHCGETGDHRSPIALDGDVTLPWTGTTVPYGSSWRTTMNNTGIDFNSDDGWGPPWAADCVASVPWTMDWVKSGSSVTSVTTGGFQKFASTAGGRQCYLSMTLYLSPFQVFTTHP